MRNPKPVNGIMHCETEHILMGAKFRLCATTMAAESRPGYISGAWSAEIDLAYPHCGCFYPLHRMKSLDKRTQAVFVEDTHSRTSLGTFIL